MKYFSEYKQRRLILNTLLFGLAFNITIIFNSPVFSQEHIKTLEEGTIEQRVEAMYNLAYSGNKAAFWYFVKFLSYKPAEGDNPLAVKCREAAAEGLGRIKDERAVKYLVEQYPAEKESSVKRKIMFAFRFYRNPEIMPFIQDALGSEDWVLRFQGIMTAASYNNKDLSGKLKEISDGDKEPSIRLAASYALVKLDSDADSNYLKIKKALLEKDPEIRYWSAHYLRLLVKTESIKDLAKALEIENKLWVRKEIESALASLYVETRNNENFKESQKYKFTEE